MKKVFTAMLMIILLLTGCSKKQPIPQPPPGGETGQKPQEQQMLQEPAKAALPGAILVMVDNHNKARPQNGVDKADLVYEILAEGGITRYLAMFYSEEAEIIGPVRSARYYFVQLAKGYNAPYAHAGGNLDALEIINKLKIKDLDEIYNSGEYFWRDSKRKMPHNLYTSTKQLIKGAKAKGYDLVPLQLPAIGSVWEGTPHQKDIRLDYSSGKYTYAVSWHYNGQEYIRSINDKPHTMADGAAIKAQNILVMAAKTREVIKEELESEIELIGKGELLYFVEGKVHKGTWEKASAESSIKFLEETGQPIKIKSGKTWVQVLPAMSKAAY